MPYKRGLVREKKQKSAKYLADKRRPRKEEPNQFEKSKDAENGEKTQKRLNDNETNQVQ